MRKLNSQLTMYDFVGVNEAHIDPEKCATFQEYHKLTPTYNFWLQGYNDHGTASGVDGGLGILLTKAFAHRFTHFSTCDVLNGRCLRLTLMGPQGTLDLYTVYADCKHESERVKMYYELQKIISPQQEALTILMGD